jgi:hypothetical protein
MTKEGRVRKGGNWMVFNLTWEGNFSFSMATLKERGKMP